MRKIALIALLAIVPVVLAGVAVATPPEIDPSDHIVTVTKIVENAPEDASFVVDVCGQAINFNENGGTQSINVGDWFDGPQTCIVSEPDDGGATSVEISGSPCEFTGREYKPESLDTTSETKSYPDEICEVTIRNEFEDEETTTTTAPPVIVEQPVLVPTPVVVSPQFTG